MARVAYLLKLPPEEDRLFRLMAKRAGLPVSVWIRQAVRAAVMESKMKRKNGLEGVSAEGEGERASLTVGLRVDKPRSTSIVAHKGTTIPWQRARRELIRLRAEQVGDKAAGATMIRCEGPWSGRPTEPVIRCEIEHMPSPQEVHTKAFQSHMLDLAELAAERFGQEEVWLRMGGKLYRASAPGEKAPKIRRRGGRIIR
jgi:hypothetical protein